MARKRKLTNLSDRCRLCLSDSGAMSNLFVESLQSEIKDLTNSTSIEIKSERSLPHNICHICLYKLNMWSEFKEQFIQSNETLLAHLEASENSDYMVPKSKLKLDESTISTEKEKCINQENLGSSISLDLANDNTIENSQPTIVGDECSSSKESSHKTDIRLDLENSETSKVKQVPKRGKTTERREASTKRWVARKKALLAATGEEASDSDSGTSDDTQLSPVQKARAKTNADKEAERKKRTARALKNLEIDVSYETKLDIENAQASVQTRSKSAQHTENQHENSRAVKKSKVSDPRENYVPRSIRSELEVGDATYIVTSTLFFADSQMPAKNCEIKDVSKNTVPSSEENNEEKNTDIFEAVQLRRVNPKMPPMKDNSLLERCLNIEVEGSELEALQHVQQELAMFVEKDMLQKINTTTRTKPNRTKDSAQTLEQQLKIIVEKAIRTNYEASQGKVKEEQSSTKNMSTAFIEAALRSPVFQPKVLVDRLDVGEASKVYCINNIQTMQTLDTVPILRKRQVHQPVKYLDYDTSAVDSGNESKCQEDEDRSKDFKYVTKVNTTKKGVRKYGPASSKMKQLVETAECDTTTAAEMRKDVKEIKQEKHMCGICSKTFDSRKDIELHVRIHKPGSIATNSTVQEEKVKRMRCKRCHEIVEARLVKMHVCHNRQTHKCNTCNMSFRTEKQLTLHLETHDQNKLKIEVLNETKEVCRPETEQTVSQNNIIPEKVKLKREQTYTCFLCDKMFTDEEVLKDHLQKHCDDISEDEQNAEKEEYQCAICSSSLDSEEALESHVEKHLFDDEDDNPDLITITNENETPEVKKEEPIFQCPECPKVFNSEVLLVMHQPLHEEEAEIAEWEKQGTNTIAYACNICEAIFPSMSELSEHLYVHNETVHMCLLCEQPFDTLAQLQQHVATH